MGAANLLLRELLRLLTPEEINELTTISGGRARIQLTDLMERRLKEEQDSGEEVGTDHKAEGKNFIKEEEAILAQELGPQVERASAFGDLEVPEGEGHIELEEDAPILKGTQFILSQKDRFKGINQRLKEQHLIRVYQKNSSFDIEQEKANRKKQDKSLSSNEGILINKRHF